MVRNNDTVERKDRKSQRNVDTKIPINNYYIFCEGTSTEPNYFEAMKQVIAYNAAYAKVVHLKIIGKGRSTLSLLTETKQYIKKNKILSGQVWCVYDKDESTDDSFNKTSQQISNLTTDELSYHAAWSNESIEYWFHKIPEGYAKDKKNAAEIFERLNEYGDPLAAIKRAKKALKDYNESDIKNCPAKINPGTTVHLLVQELAKYFPEDLRKEYLGE